MPELLQRIGEAAEKRALAAAEARAAEEVAKQARIRTALFPASPAAREAIASSLTGHKAFLPPFLSPPSSSQAEIMRGQLEASLGGSLARALEQRLADLVGPLKRDGFATDEKSG